VIPELTHADLHVLQRSTGAVLDSEKPVLIYAARG
jgi:hypothetical protein